jgi:hypothetical protein
MRDNGLRRMGVRPVGGGQASGVAEARVHFMKQLKARTLALAWSCAAVAAPALAQGTVYRCPGNPVVYTDQISAKEANEKGCRTIEGAPITVMQSVKPRPAPASAVRGEGGKVSAADQRSRDNDARRILETELRREEERLAALKKDYNNGEPERLGDERNYQKYIDRVAEMKASIQRKESDIASIKREIDKLTQ